MKNIFLIVSSLLSSLLSSSQNAISFGNLQAGYTFMTEQAVYINSDKLVKADYQGNILWSRSGDYINRKLKVEDNGVYIFNSLNVTKLDTAGNFIWSIDFTDRLCNNSMQPNSIADVVINEDRIYVLSNQVSAMSITYQSVFTLDTSGTKINSWCGESYHDHYFQKGIKRQNGGAFLGGIERGNIKSAESKRVNADGLLVTNRDMNIFQFPGAQFNFIHSVIRRNDQAHVYLINSFWPGSPGYPYLVVESDQGFVLSSRDYHTPQIMYGFEFINAAVDLQNNLYILCQTQNEDFVLLKTDPSGTILINKAWSYIVHQAYHLGFASTPERTSMIFKNDSLLVMCTINGSTSILTFDSLLNAACFMPDTSIQIVEMNDVLSYQAGYLSVTQTNTNLVPFASQHINGANPITNSLCQILKVDYTKSETSVHIYPNPAASEINIYNVQSVSQLMIFNFVGQEIIAEYTMTSDKIVLNTEKLKSGIYFISGLSASGYFNTKMIIHR